ncbi:hypothetical protein ORQ98_26740 [Spartinivicinus sp. A2-2]|uniref:Uncharacterized protein n=1 Tax=Spartinivicinus poritis TaxID=2994640 RepID=A0ABT5UGT3_9GAMM|nr:hypothetical protein [Spartinivicinus sp. A2-2]
MTDLPEQGSLCDDFRPYYAVDIEVLNAQGKPDKKLPILPSVMVPGKEKGLYGLPELGTWERTTDSSIKDECLNYQLETVHQETQAQTSQTTVVEHSTEIIGGTKAIGAMSYKTTLRWHSRISSNR